MNLAALSRPPASLTQSAALEEPAMPRFAVFLLTLLSACLAAFLLWAAVSPVDEIASASGQIVPAGYVQDVQHMDGGIVTAILVQDGEVVEKGQPLLRLDPTNANADLGQMQARQIALQGQVDRLRIFSGGRHGRLNAGDQAILGSMEEARLQQQDTARSQIDQKEKDLAAATATRETLQQGVNLKAQEDAIYQRTLRSGSSSQLQALTSERELADLQGQLAQAVEDEKRDRAALDEANSRLKSVGADLRQQAMKELGQAQAELDELNKSIAKQHSAADRTVLVAPVRGIVKGLSIHTLGAVIEPGKTVLEIVPADGTLMVEALIQPGDIGNIKIGEDVRIKVSAFDFSRFGTVAGKMQNVSASTFQDEKGQSFYKARVALTQDHVGPAAGANIILPGMTVQADIVTGHQTVLEYLLKPLHVASTTAFHER